MTGESFLGLHSHRREVKPFVSSMPFTEWRCFNTRTCLFTMRCENQRDCCSGKFWRDWRLKARIIGLIKAQCEPYKAINSGTNREVHDRAPIGLEATVTQRFGEVGHEGKVIDGVSKQDCDEIFDPSARGNSEELPRLARHTSVRLRKSQRNGAFACR